jgi:hypothetical protein
MKLEGEEGNWTCPFCRRTGLNNIFECVCELSDIHTGSPVEDKNNMNTQPEQWEDRLMNEFCVMFERSRDDTNVERLEKFISQLLKTQHNAIISEINPVELAERIVIEYANISGRESENREYVRQSARTVLEKIVNNLEQDL